MQTEQAKRDHREARAWAGYRHHRRARSTGTLVVLVDGQEQGVTTPGDGDGRWALICDEHASLLTDTNQTRLRGHMTHPEEWCLGCAAIVDGPLPVRPDTVTR